jgi:hypothetical protein
MISTNLNKFKDNHKMKTDVLYVVNMAIWYVVIHVQKYFIWNVWKSNKFLMENGVVLNVYKKLLIQDKLDQELNKSKKALIIDLLYVF